MTRIFVFGSNKAGRHGAGAALFARKNKGALYGQGEGIQGNSYAIPTKDRNIQTLPLSFIKKNVDRFLIFARDNPDMTFDLTPIGCGLAGYSKDEIGPFFCDAPDNVVKTADWFL